MDEQQLAELTHAIGSIAHGDTSGPTGLEALGMALAGEGEPGRVSLAGVSTSSADTIAAALLEVAVAIRDTAPNNRP